MKARAYNLLKIMSVSTNPSRTNVRAHQLALGFTLSPGKVSPEEFGSFCWVFDSGLLSSTGSVLNFACIKVCLSSVRAEEKVTFYSSAFDVFGLNTAYPPDTVIEINKNSIILQVCNLFCLKQLLKKKKKKK